ncbi:MAG: response regulator [Pseudomonadota bacterium]
MDDIDSFVLSRPPTAARPLLGLTVLVVEDSRFACEAMRLLCLRSGARIRRADCLRSARRHLQVYRPSVVIVDLGLPDGSGADLIDELNNTSPRVEVVLGTSGDDGAEARAMTAGADGFMPKPVASLANFQETILSFLPAERRPVGPRILSDEHVTPDPISYRDDMAHVADLLSGDQDPSMADYVGQFLAGVASSAGDGILKEAADRLIAKRALGQAVSANMAEIGGLVQDRMLTEEIV